MRKEFDKNTKVFIAGHNGMVGSAVFRKLKLSGYNNLITVNREKLNLTNQRHVNDFFKDTMPDVVINAAAKVGGILANSTNPYDFIMKNLQIQNNLIDGAYTYDVSKFIFLGSSCIYPKFAHQPLKENYLLTGSLEPTNEWYAIAKIAGLKSCEAIFKQHKRQFLSLMPTNLYGYYDNFDVNSSHVLPAMIQKFHIGKLNSKTNITLWGSGNPMREFLFVDDLADAVIFSLENKLSESLYNIGTGKEISIKNLAIMVKDIVGYKGDILWDSSKPDGTPRKLLDTSKINKLGWKYKTELSTGISKTYEWYKKNIDIIKQIKL